MKQMRLKKVMFVLALMGTSFAAFNAVRAEDEPVVTEVTESFEEVCESQTTVYIEQTEIQETECEETIIDETVIDETVIEEIDVEETEAEETEIEESETEPTEEETVEYDVPSTVINGWYVPAFNYNGNGTITYYLPDGTAFYNVEMNELELPSYAWAYTGLRGYVDYQYGSVNYLNDEEMSSFEAAAEAVLSGQGA